MSSQWRTIGTGRRRGGDNDQAHDHEVVARPKAPVIHGIGSILDLGGTALSHNVLIWDKRDGFEKDCIAIRGDFKRAGKWFGKDIEASSEEDKGLLWGKHLTGKIEVDLLSDDTAIHVRRL